MKANLPSEYMMYGDGGYKYPWDLNEIRQGIVLYKSIHNKLPSIIGMNPKDILQMGKIKYKGTEDYLRGVRFKGVNILVIPVKTCLRGTISYYI